MTWRPALVLRMGMSERRSGGGAAPVSSSFSFALMKASSHSVFL